MPQNKIDEGVIYHFDDLPKEWQDVDFLRKQMRQTLKLTGLFSTVAAVGWVNHHDKVAEIKVNPGAGQHYEVPAIGITTLAPTIMAILGAAVAIRLKLLVREGEKKQSISPSPPSP